MALLLDDHAQRPTLRLTTVGRKSGKERTAEVWFVLDGGAILLQAGPKAEKGWLANLTSNPSVRLDLGGVALAGRATRIDATDHERVAALFRQKYWLARLARWFGSRIGRGTPVRVELTEA